MRCILCGDGYHAENHELNDAKTRQTKVANIVRGDSKLLGPTVKERMIAGRALRQRVPRTSPAKWVPSVDRPDPIELLKKSDRGRLPQLLPIRYLRMRQSPFATLTQRLIIPCFGDFVFKNPLKTSFKELREPPRRGFRNTLRSRVTKPA